jgi:hypothetical protein
MCTVILVGKSEEERPCRRPRQIEDYIRIDLMEMEWEGVD